jgi:hypothetical protein
MICRHQHFHVAPSSRGPVQNVNRLCRCFCLVSMPNIEKGHCAAAAKKIEETVPQTSTTCRNKRLMEFISQGTEENRPQRPSRPAQLPTRIFPLTKGPMQQDRENEVLNPMRQLTGQAVKALQQAWRRVRKDQLKERKYETRGSVRRKPVCGENGNNAGPQYGW